MNSRHGNGYINTAMRGKVGLCPQAALREVPRALVGVGMSSDEHGWLFEDRAMTYSGFIRASTYYRFRRTEQAQKKRPCCGRGARVSLRRQSGWLGKAEQKNRIISDERGGVGLTNPTI
jgi:hypothetical protein